MIDARLGTSNLALFDDEVPVMGSLAWNSWDRGALRWEYGSTTTNNGNVTRQEHMIPQPASQNMFYTAQQYGYDALNRLLSVTEKTGTESFGDEEPALFTQAYGYDRWGNRTIKPVGQGSTQPGWLNLKQFQVQATTNRLLAPSDVDGDGRDTTDQMRYDEVGNLIFDTWTDNISASQIKGGKRSYDAENRMVKAVGPDGKPNSYVYDASGRRTRRVIYNNTNNMQETWWQVYGVGGELVAEYKLVNNTPQLQKEYGYRNGQLLVIYDAAETGDKQWQWLVTDHLGTPRMVVDRSGSLAGIKRHDYLPFGEELFAGANAVRTIGNGYVADKVRQQFGTYERDNETGLDFAQARYYGSVQGRFTSPDPYDVNIERQYAADERDANEIFSNYAAQPQHWNHYAYALNNPLKYVDPEGLLEYETTLLGQKIKVNISDSIDKKEQEIIRKKIDAGIALINKGADKLSKEEQSIIKNVKGITVRDDVTRSGIDLGTGVFTIIKTPDLIYSKDSPDYPSAEWIAGIIIHDSFHPDQNRRKLRFDSGASGAEREREANRFASRCGCKIGLSESIVNQFESLGIDPGTRYKEPYKVIKPGGTGGKPPEKKKP